MLHSRVSGSGEVCDLDSKTCVPCVDDALGALADHGFASRARRAE